MAEKIRFREAWSSASEYLFGNLFVGIVSLALLAISGYATWSGMHDFIIGISSSEPSQERQLPGGFSITTDTFVIAIVAVLTLLMWIALRQSVSSGQRLRRRLVTFPLYLFLALWSIGFGYGFWWSLIAGGEATRTSLASLQQDAQDASSAIAARLDAVRAQIDNVATWSDSQMAREESSGGSCGVPSNAGRGPLYNARKTVRDQVTSIRDGINHGWFEPIKADIDQLRQLSGVADGGTTQDRQRRFEEQANNIRARARDIANRSNEFGASNAAEMRALADTVSVEPNKAGFSCYDPTLAQRLRDAANQAAQSTELRLHEATFNEGPAGVANAIKRLWGNIGAYSYSVVRYIASAGNEATLPTANGEPITGRDVISLLATLGVDIGIFAMALLLRPIGPPPRQDALTHADARIHQANPRIVQDLKKAIETAIRRAPDADDEWIRQHFIHHNGSSYFVIPNLYNVGDDKKEELKALALNQLAGVFSDLGVVRALTPRELKNFGKEETRQSYSDLSRYHRQRQQQDGQATTDTEPNPVENHGLLSKAERALDIAGWGPKAKRDTEIFRLVETRGLTPLLAVLNEMTFTPSASAGSATDKQSSPQPGA
jgi:hypothetical protein